MIYNIVLVVLLMPEFNSISELKKLLEANCKVEKVEPPVFASDAEINIVRVSILCLDGKRHIIKAYKEEASALREFIRTHK